MPEVFALPFLAYLPNLLVALLVLIVGWLVALLISRLVGNLLRRTSLDDRLAGALRGGQPERVPIERWVQTGVFWLLMAVVIVIFLQMLNLGAVSAPLNNLLSQILGFIPGVISALLLLLLAWIIATLLRAVITRVLSASAVSKRLSDNADIDTRERVSLGQTVGNVVYWLVFLLFLPAILDALNLQGILAPVQGMVDSILSVLPNLLGAALVLIIGYFVARIIRQIVTNLLAGVGLDRLLGRAGTNVDGQRLSEVIGTIVFVLILIPVAIAALNVLNIPAISDPASSMLFTLLNAIPAIFGAFLLLAIAYFVARMVGTLVASILAGLGFNRLFAAMGIFPNRPSASNITLPSEGDPGAATRRTTEPGGVQPGRTTPSEIVGYIVMVAIMLFAATEAARMLGFIVLADLISEFIVAAVNILVGLVVFGLGLYLANLAYRAIRGTTATNAGLLATAARVAIIVFSGALALRQMGIGEDIVNLAFGLLLGAVAVATALAFGLGGREQAAEQLSRWRRDIDDMPPSPPIPTTGPSGPTGPTGSSGPSRGPSGSTRDIPTSSTFSPTPPMPDPGTGNPPDVSP